MHIVTTTDSKNYSFSKKILIENVGRYESNKVSLPYYNLGSLGEKYNPLRSKSCLQ